MKRLIALLLCGLVAVPGCATARLSRSAPYAPSQRLGRADPSVMADYIRQLPVGSRVRISLSNGAVLRATLMKRDADPIVVLRRTRVPEPPLEIELRDILGVELDTTKGSAGRTVGVAAAAAASATLGVILLLAAIFAD